MKQYLSFFLAVLLPFQLFASAVKVDHLTTEGMVNPMGIDITTPRFSWKISSDKKDVRQTGYEIIVASSEEKLDKDDGDLWNSEMISSDEQLWVPYSGKALTDNQHAFWKVRVTTNKGRSDWSMPQQFSIGLLGETHWRGRWIGLERLADGDEQGMHTKLVARYLRKEFKSADSIVRATAFVAGFGLYEFYVNGNIIGNREVLRPVPSDFRKTIYYNTYDITEFLTSGETNALGICLEAGRAFPPRQEKPYKTPYFGLPKCRVNVIVEYANGRKETWATDETWRLTTDGPVRYANEYDGEMYDSRKELDGWTLPGYDDTKWQQAQRAAIPEGTLRAQMTPNMVVGYGPIDRITMKKWGKGVIVDLGQNLSGYVLTSVHGNDGDTIRIKYAEKLDSTGGLYTANLRNAEAEDIYICNGKAREWFPSFVYHGFRYIYVTGLKEAEINDFVPLVVADPMASTGRIETADTILNKVIRNAWWGIRDNYKGMPVDCPQRNERQPWLGDRTVGCLGESFLFNNERLYTKWMRDLCEGVRSDGAISNVTPAFWNYYEDNMTWPAVFPFACDILYEQYGNRQPIIDSYPYIKKWLDHMLKEYCHDGIITKDKYGDWCVPPEKLTITHSNDPARQTDGTLISTAYGVRILQLMEKFARLQGMDAEAKGWKEKRRELTDAFNKRFLTVRRGTSPRPGHVLYPDSVFYGNNTATANLLPLAFGIVPDSVKSDVLRNVVKNIIEVGKGHVTCGVIGISWLLRALSDNGFADVAYMLATQRTYPSWGYMTENDATTIWELWNGDKANPSMNSGNHVMLLGDLLTWCFQYLGGIRQDTGSVAYKHIILKPEFGIEDCFNIKCTFSSPYGDIVSNWTKTLERLHWEVRIPANTTATVCLPDGKTKEIGSGEYTFDCVIPHKDASIVKDEFLYDYAPFYSAHASTITETKDGDLLAAYFGGTWERNPNVCIWVSRKAKGSDHWEAPRLAADGVFALSSHDAALAGLSGINDSTTAASAGPAVGMTAKDLLENKKLKRKACWNPVLFTMPDGEILLFYKVGTTVADWQGCLVRSRDGGRTWSKREMLPKGFIGPVKNKPELINGRLICPSSTEGKWWTFHVEIYDLKTKTWKYVGPVEADSAMLTDDCKMHPIKCIQPSILRLADGRLKVLMRTHNGRLATSYSYDGGDTWTKVSLTDIPNNQSGTDAVTLRDGRHILVYNDFATIPGEKKGPRTPLCVAISDDGEHFRNFVTLEDSPVDQYSYPAVIQGSNGNLHITYTWRRLRIAYKEIRLPHE